MPSATDAPADAPTIESVVARALGGVEALYEEGTVAWAAGLPELDFARLKARLREKRIQIGDFSKLVDGAKKAAKRGRPVAADGEEWRAALRPGQYGEPAATFGNLCDILLHTYEGRLSYNLMSSCPHIDGRQLEDLDVSAIRYELERTERVAFSAEDVASALTWVGFKVKPHHPVRDYLTGLPPWDNQKRLDTIAQRVLGLREDDRLAATMVRKWIQALVARAMVPGEKADNCLVFYSKEQGLKKSMFFKILGGQFHGQGRPDLTDRKGIMILHQHWTFEIGEIDAMLRKHDHADTKRFVSQEDDTIVPMYGRAPKRLLRSFMTGGTTNQEKILTDPTGDRRWWIVEVLGVISREGQTIPQLDLRVLTDERDMLFAEALASFRAYQTAKAAGVEPDLIPERWWLSEEEERERRQRTQRHQVEEPLESPVGAWLAGEPVTCTTCKGTKRGGGIDPVSGAPRLCWMCNGEGRVRRAEPLRRDGRGHEFVTTHEVLLGALGITPKEDHGATVRVANVLLKLGWTTPDERTRKRRGTDRERGTIYYAPLTDEQRAELETRAAVGGDPDAEPLAAPSTADTAAAAEEERAYQEVLARQIAERDEADRAAREAAELTAARAALLGCLAGRPRPGRAPRERAEKQKARKQPKKKAKHRP